MSTCVVARSVVGTQREVFRDHVIRFWNLPHEITSRFLFAAEGDTYKSIGSIHRMMVNPGDDFQGYMDDVARKAQARAEYQAMVDEHEEWRQTTWAGFCVRQLQALGHHVAPFFEAVAGLLQQDHNSPQRILLAASLRILTITAYILAAYVMARIINAFLGKEIIIEVDDEQDETEEAPSAPRRSARSKKQR